jgi:putative ABC transport system permease protein
MMRRVLRGLLRSPAFIASVILTLALAITANLTVMSLLSATLLRKPPVNDPDKVVVAIELRRSDGLAPESVRPSRYVAWRSSSAFDASAALRTDFATILWDGGSQRIPIARVTPDFFKVLGTPPASGATFGGGDSESPSMVLSHRLWIREFGGDRGIIGKTVSSDARSYTVVGVMPPEFRIPSMDPEAWVPLQDDDWKNANAAAPRLRVLARLGHGISASQAERELTAISNSLPSEVGHQETDVRPRIMSLQDYIVESAGIKPVVRVLMGAMVLVLLIACVNVSHLLFVRMSAKTSDLALQLSLGAAKSRLILGVVYESVFIAIASVALGLLLSTWSTRMLQSRLTFNDYVAALQLGLDAPTVWFSVGIVLVLVTLLSAIPGMFLRSVHIDAILRESGRGVLSSRSRVRAAAALVMIQAVSASILLILTSAMVVKFIVTKRTSVGFDSSNVVVARLTLERRRFVDTAGRSQFIHVLLERLRNQVGVESVAAANSLPMLGGGSMQMDAGGQGTQWRSVKTRTVSPGFFATLKIPILRGTDLPDRASDSDRLIVVNDAFAARFLSAHPLDQRVRLRENDNSAAFPYRVVGVAGNTKHWFGEPGDVPDVYRVYSEAPSADTMIAMRSNLDPASLAQVVRSVVRALEPSQPVGRITTYRSALENQESDDVVLTTILIFIAALAVVLASLGIYGVLSYSIQMRRREFGLRLALGSTPIGLTRHVLKTSALLMGIGVACGLLLTPVLIRLLDSVFRGKVTHIGTIISIVLIVEIFSILLATWVPARQASRVDPIELLRAM